jgi:translocation protein SEC66
MISIRSAKQALSTLLARGSVGDELWQRYLRAEKEMEEELKDVVTEANALAPGWGHSIFQSANEMANNYTVRKRYEEVQAHAKSEREWWDRKRAATQAEFMKELDEGSAAISSKASAVTMPARGVSPAPVTLAAGAERGSDEDAVLVDAGGPTTPGLGGGKSGKKKKGKK